MVFLLISAFLIVLPSACREGSAGPIATTTLPTPSTEISGTILTTPVKTPDATLTPTQTSGTPVTPPTITPALLTPPSPEELAENNFVLPEIPRLLCEQLKQKMDNGSDFVLIDTRSNSSFKLDYLPGAINIPLIGSQPEWLNDQLAAIPEMEMAIFYCDCPDDIESATMAEKMILVRSGSMSNVKVLWKGYYRWLELGYPTTQ